MADGEQAIERSAQAVPRRGRRHRVATGTSTGSRSSSTGCVEICRWLRDDPATAFDYLVDVTAVHWPDEPQPMEMVYHLYSYARNDRLRLKVAHRRQRARADAQRTSGSRPTGTSARPTTCSASGSRATRTCAGS